MTINNPESNGLAKLESSSKTDQTASSSMINEILQNFHKFNTSDSTSNSSAAAHLPSLTIDNAYYVSANASGHGRGALGSASNPFKTLDQAKQAMEHSNIKETIVEGGKYDLSSSPLNLGKADSGMSFVADSKNGPVILDGGNKASRLVSIDGADKVTLQGFTMQNTRHDSIWNSQDWSAAHSGGDAVYATNSRGDNFADNTIKNVGLAFNMRGVNDSSFKGNSVDNVQEAFNMMPGGGKFSDNNQIEENHITNVHNVTGLHNFNMGAITLDAASNNLVKNNYISDTDAAGVVIERTFNHDANGDSIIGNVIENTNKAAKANNHYDASTTNPSDMGAIYAWQGAGSTNDMKLTISDNYVKNAGQGFENVGIYLDDGVNGAKVNENYVEAGGRGWDMLVHGGSNNTIEQNFLNLNSPAGIEKGILYQNDGPQMIDNSIHNNEFWSDSANGGAYTWYDKPGDMPSFGGNQYKGVQRKYK